MIFAFCPFRLSPGFSGFGHTDSLVRPIWLGPSGVVAGGSKKGETPPMGFPRPVDF